MSTLSSANVTDVNLVLKERTHMRLCLNMLIFMHNLGNWLIAGFWLLSTLNPMADACRDQKMLHVLTGCQSLLLLSSSWQLSLCVVPL